MSRMLHRPGAPVTGQKVLLATPAFQGVEAIYAFALFESAKALAAAGIETELAILSGDCHVDDSRNRLVRQFLTTDCTDLVFLDADLRWYASDIVALCQHDRDVVAATYPLKQKEEDFPARFMPGEIWSDKDGLIEVEGIPTGFLRIRRCVLEKLFAVSKTYQGSANDETLTPLIFERTLEDGTRWGGDYTFCRKWKALGGRIWLMPSARLEHVGANTWSGNVGSYLRRKNGIALKEGLEAISLGKDTVETFIELFEAWENPWSATPQLLIGLSMIARETKGPILECGSGLSTLIMAASNHTSPIWALEHNPSWESKVSGALNGATNVKLCHAPINGNGWYTPPIDMPKKFGLVLVDGPPRGDNRAGILDAGIEARAWVLDDANDPNTAAMADVLCERHGLEALTIPAERPFTILCRKANL